MKQVTFILTLVLLPFLGFPHLVSSTENKLFQIWEESETKQRFFAYFEQEMVYQGQTYRYVKILDAKGETSFAASFILSGWIGNSAGEYHKLDLAEYGCSLTILNFTPLYLKDGEEDALKPPRSNRYYKVSCSPKKQEDSISTFQIQSDLQLYEGKYIKQRAFISLSVTEKREAKTKKYNCIYANQILWQQLGKPVFRLSKNLFPATHLQQTYQWEHNDIHEIIRYAEPFWVDSIPIYYLNTSAYQGEQRIRGQLLNKFMFYWQGNQLRILSPYSLFYENDPLLKFLVLFELDKPVGTIWKDEAEYGLAYFEQIKLETITWDSLNAVEKYHFSAISPPFNEVTLIGFDFCKEKGFLCFYYQNKKGEILVLKQKA